MNAEFQRIARREKKAFLGDQCKEIEENSRMGKTRDLFKKIRDTKAVFYAKTGLIKDRNGMGLTETEDIKKSWQEYTESESEVAQSYLTLCHPMDCSLLGSPIHSISRQEYWSGLPFPSPGDLPNPEIEPRSPTL